MNVLRTIHTTHHQWDAERKVWAEMRAMAMQQNNIISELRADMKTLLARSAPAVTERDQTSNKRRRVDDGNGSGIGPLFFSGSSSSSSLL
jgi:hypothetical protein